jgi:hypothetical protein
MTRRPRGSAVWTIALMQSDTTMPNMPPWTLSGRAHLATCSRLGQAPFAKGY